MDGNLVFRAADYSYLAPLRPTWRVAHCVFLHIHSCLISGGFRVDMRLVYTVSRPSIRERRFSGGSSDGMLGSTFFPFVVAMASPGKNLIGRTLDGGVVR